MENKRKGKRAGWVCEQQGISYRALRENLGNPVIITLSDTIYQGDLIQVDRHGSLMLSKVKNLSSGDRKPGVHLYTISDILHVEMQVKKEETHPVEQTGNLLSAVRDGNQEAEENLIESSIEKYLSAFEWRDVEPSTQDPVIIKEDQPDSNETDAFYTSLQTIARAVENLQVNFTVIDQLKVMCNLAIKHLLCQADIGLAAAGSNLSRHGKLCWLQVASKNHVYIFDIETLGSNVFKYGLKALLEDEKIVKVIHDCRGLSDCLYHQYGVEVRNVFDTQVADIFLFHKQTGGILPHRPSTLEECLKKRLNIPPSQISFFSDLQGIMKDNGLLWSLCTMPLHLQKALALEASYVLSLRVTMINAMLADYFMLVNGYVKVYTQSNVNIPNWTQLSDSWLPEDFQMFVDLQAKPRKNYLDVKEGGITALNGKPLKYN
ncbi:piRNA biogenesis protein EXD1-like [Mantella aurantiaca]